MDYNFIDKEVNQGGYIFLNDYEFSSLQGQNIKIDYKISVLNGTAKANTSYDFQVFFLQFSCPAPFQIKNRPSVSTFMKLELL